MKQPNVFNNLSVGYFLLTFCLFLPFSQYAQCLNTRAAYENYFVENFRELDPIEGFWSVNQYATGMTYYSNYSFNEVQVEEIAIIEEDGKFHVCPAKSNYRIFRDEESFTKTAAPGIYLHSRFFNDVLIEAKSNATLGGGVLNYKYEVPQESIELLMGWKYNGERFFIESTLVKLFPSAEQIYERIYPEGEEPAAWSGTCFAIDKNLLVTNHHVIDGATELSIRGVNGDYKKVYPIRVIATDEKTDLALVEITDPNFHGFESVPLKLNPRLIEVGTSVYAYGYPMITTMGDELKLTSGIVSARSGFQGDLSTYQISTPVQGGNSGGPLITENGDVIGVINAKHRNAENANYAIKMNYLYSLISSAGLEIPKVTNTKNYSSIVDLTREFRKYIFIVEARNK